jgi:hypothetical protein
MKVADNAAALTEVAPSALNFASGSSPSNVRGPTSPRSVTPDDNPLAKCSTGRSSSELLARCDLLRLRPYFGVKSLTPNNLSAESSGSSH